MNMINYATTPLNLEVLQDKNITLRPYQTESISAIKEQCSKGIRRQIISLPPGSGKTVIFASLIKDTGMRALVFVHTRELLEQAQDKIKMIAPGLGVGLVDGDHKQFDSPVVICSIQAAGYESNLSKLINQDFELIIADECHHFATDKTRKILNALGVGEKTNKLLVGFTATPSRNDNKGLGEVFDQIVFERDINFMIKNGYLCPPKAFKIATDLDLTSIKIQDGDFQVTSLAKVMNTEEMRALVVQSYKEKALRKKTICFCVSIQHAKDLSLAFKQQGITSNIVYGEMPSVDRATILQEYSDGKISVLCNAQVLTEGFDEPSTEAVILARPTKLKNLFQQMVGRGLRLWPNKHECIVLDFSDKNHTLCTTSMLLRDITIDKVDQQGNKKYIGENDPTQIPKKLNKGLKAVLLSYDPFSESFSWQREGQIYLMEGLDYKRLEIVPQSAGFWCVVFSDSDVHKIIAQGLTFEYAFASADAFAKEHRELFILHDREAPWRNRPISEKQIQLFKSKGYKGGIEVLTRGQANDLIRSGCLSKNRCRR